MEPEDGEGQLPAGFEGMEVDGKRFILTPEFDSNGNRVQRLKIPSVTKLIIQQNIKTPRYPNGRFHVLTTGQVKAWCSAKKESKGMEKSEDQVIFENIWMTM